MFTEGKLCEHLIRRKVLRMFDSRNEALQTAIIFGFPIFLACTGSFAAFLLPGLGVVGIILLLILMLASSLIIATKLRAKDRSGKLIEWGPQNMTSTEKIYYLLGYLLCLFAFLSVLVIHFTGIRFR